MNTRTLDELASVCGASLEGDAARAIRGPANLRDAEADEISFCAHPRFRPDLERTRAAAVLVPRDMAIQRTDLALLRCEDPSRAFTSVVRLFQKPRRVPSTGVHPSAVVEPGAQLAEGVSVGPLCHVAAGARIGARTVLHAQVDVGEGAEVGEDCELFPGVVLYDHVRLGDRCSIHAGSVIGADGHGWEPSARGWVKVPQCGTVVVEDDVDIGANTTIDRARFGATRIGRGSKLDNLVHVAHNVVIGPGSMIVAQVGIAGSTRLGRNVVLGGQAGLGGHIELGDRVRVGGQAGVTTSFPAGVELWGTPARPIRETLRTMAHAGRAEGLARRVRELARRLAELEARGGSLSEEGSGPRAPQTRKESR